MTNDCQENERLKNRVRNALRLELQQARDENATLEMDLEELTNKYHECQQQLSKRQLDLYKMTEQRNQYKSALDSNDPASQNGMVPLGDYSRLLSERDNLQQQLAQSQAELSDERAGRHLLSKATDRIADLENERDDLQHSRLDELEKQANLRSEEFGDLLATNLELKSVNTKLQLRLDESIDILLRWKNLWGLPTYMADRIIRDREDLNRETIAFIAAQHSLSIGEDEKVWELKHEKG